jgi:hypothetical protein
VLGSVDLEACQAGGFAKHQERRCCAMSKYKFSLLDVGLGRFPNPQVVIHQSFVIHARPECSQSVRKGYIVPQMSIKLMLDLSHLATPRVAIRQSFILNSPKELIHAKPESSQSIRKGYIVL